VEEISAWVKIAHAWVKIAHTVFRQKKKKTSLAIYSKNNNRKILKTI